LPIKNHMYLSDEVVTRAIADGVLTQQQLDQLRQLSASANADANDKPLVGAEGEESLKFVRSFGDVFIAIGVALLIIGVQAVLPPDQHILKSTFAVALGFGLGEWLLRKKRLALPGIVLIVGTTLLFAFGLGALLLDGGKLTHLKDRPLTVVAIPLLTVGYVAAFYFRYKLPFAFAVAVASALAVPFMLLGVYDAKPQRYVFVAGIVALAIAIWFDKQDRFRTTRLSDCAFWLHVLAAPLLTIGLMIFLFNDKALDKDITSSLIFIACFCVFCLVALFLDRRALLVSSFSYMLYSIGGVITQSFGADRAFALSALFLGALVVGLGVYWHPIRARLFARFSDSALAQWVPPFTTKQSHSTSA
jgi:hypothetical protein